MSKSDVLMSFDSFKTFMVSNNVPNYINRYCNDLSDVKWIWFYAQMSEPLHFVADIDYLLYILKWILKSDFKDLSYEVYFYEIMDAEGRPESSIKDEFWPMLTERYSKQLEEDISLML
jgi:hypothetical protein